MVRMLAADLSRPEEERWEGPPPEKPKLVILSLTKRPEHGEVVLFQGISLQKLVLQTERSLVRLGMTFPVWFFGWSANVLFLTHVIVSPEPSIARRLE